MMICENSDGENRNESRIVDSLIREVLELRSNVGMEFVESLHDSFCRKIENRESVSSLETKESGENLPSPVAGSSNFICVNRYQRSEVDSRTLFQVIDSSSTALTDNS